MAKRNVGMFTLDIYSDTDAFKRCAKKMIDMIGDGGEIISELVVGEGKAFYIVKK